MIAHSSPRLGGAEVDAAVAVLRSGQLVGGSALREFRRRLESVGAARRSFVFPSGRVAILAALTALNLEPGRAVVVQTYVCDAVVWAIKKAGLVPAFCDIGSGWVSTPDTMARSLSDKISAIVLAPPFGLFQTARPFRDFGVPIIHDLCQASPAVVRKRWAEAGDLSVLSFHPTKYVCAGGGGAVLLRDDARTDRFERFEAEWSQAAPVDEMQSAIGDVQLQRLPEFHERRSRLASVYRAELPHDATAPLLDAADIADGDLFRFVLRRRGFDLERIQHRFAALGVAVRRGVDQLAHRRERLPDTAFPNAARAFSESLSLPFYPKLDERQAAKILNAAHSVLGA